MISGWRGFALTVGVLLAAGGVAVWKTGGGLILLIFAAVVIVSALAEPIYGATVKRPAGSNWRATDEKFVDPETGQLVTVWFDSATGERRYVSNEEKSAT